VTGKELLLVKVNNGFAYSTDADRESASSWKIGQAIKISAVMQSKRSLKYHQRYWAGLIAITLEYWEPDTNMTTEGERALIKQFCGVLDGMTGGTEIAYWGDEFLANLSQKRAQKIQVPHKTSQDLHDWIKDKIGHYDIVMTPSGPKRKLKSINFNAMKSNEEFEDFYKKAFNACWRYVLSLTFKNEQDCNDAVNQLLSVG
jgi:hypothetical protein